jgi:4-amino-4-deoxy-L-arabinose transferase-like glycosyltransferase
MLVPQNGFEEYILTAGILLAFSALVLSIVLGRKHIADAMRSYGINRNHLLYAALILLIFVSVELYLVKPTQQLFFDDAIYQAGAQMMLHEGQAWMCDYGTPTFCYLGEVFHEPIGTSFNIAIAFGLLGVHEWTAYYVSFVAAIVSVFLVFLIAFMLSRDFRVAAFSEFLMALSPMLLVWAFPTTSDIYAFTYALVAVFFMLIFLRSKNIYTFSMLLFSAAFVTYMKVDEAILLFVILIGYLILDDKNITASLHRNYNAFKKIARDSRYLILLVLFAASLVPEVIYTYNQFVAGDYGAAGTQITNTCASQYTGAQVKGNFGFQNFNYNICSNLAFWLGAFDSQYVMQPLAFTAFAVVGAMSMIFMKYKKELLFLAIWFFTFFIIYTAFYAGSVTYGVDWRFMLSVIAQVSILGGFGCVAVLDIIDSLYAAVARGNIRKTGRRALHLVIYAIIIVICAFSIYLLAPFLGVNPANIPQAGDARFYESFVYNESYLVPNKCLILSYDPTLMNLVNKTSAQLFYAYNSSEMASFERQYSCIVVDYGYWCYTPNNLCTGLKNIADLVPIVNATYAPMNKTFGFYYLRNYGVAQNTTATIKTGRG